MKQLGIQKPCAEKWSEMTPTAQGAFCSQCAKNVIDLSSSSHAEIRAVMKAAGGEEVCARIRRSQLDSFNQEMRAWQLSSPRTFQSAMVFSLVVVFGLTLFSCSNEKEQKTIREIQAIGQMISVPETETAEEVSEPAVREVIPPVAISAVEVLSVVEYPSPQKEEVIENIFDMEYMIQGGIGFYQAEAIPMPVYIDEVIEYDENGAEIPKVFSSIAYPNPATDRTTLEVKLPEDGMSEISLYDLTGKLVQPVFSGGLKRGTHNYPVEVSELPVGMYLFVVRSGTHSETVRIIKN